MRAEVKVGLIVALVAFAGGAIWLLSRKSDKLNSLPITKTETEAASKDSVRLSGDTVPFAKVPSRPRSAPRTTPGRGQPTPPPARRSGPAARPQPQVRPQAGQDGKAGQAGPARPATKPETLPLFPTASPGPALPGALPAGGPGTTPPPAAKEAPGRTAAPAGKTSPGTAKPATTGSPGTAGAPPVHTAPRATGIKTPDAKIPTIIPPRKRGPFANGPDRTGGARKTTASAQKTYTVEAGDRLIDIARDEYGDGRLWKAIVAANPDLEDPDRLLVGQKIRIPTLDEARRLLGGAAPAAELKPATRAEKSPVGGTTYVVGEGDSLIKIARHVLGDAARWKEIYELNRDRLESPDLIRPGMELRLPAAKPEKKATGKD